MWSKVRKTMSNDNTDTDLSICKWQNVRINGEQTDGGRASDMEQKKIILY